MELANLVDVDVVDPGALGRHCRPTNLVTVCHCVFACCPLDMDIAVLAGHWPAIGCWPKLLMTCKAGLNGNNERQFLLHQLLLGNKTPFFSLSMLTTPDGHRALFFFLFAFNESTYSKRPSHAAISRVWWPFTSTTLLVTSEFISKQSIGP